MFKMGNMNSSFGVEIEFVVATLDGREPRAKPHMFRNSPGNPIVYEMSEAHLPNRSPEQTAQRAIRVCIEKALVGHRGDRVITSQNEILADVNSLHLSKYGLSWGVGRDVSVAMDPTLVREDKSFKHYTFINVEITSPALLATEKPYNEVRRAVTALHHKFWILAPPTAGLHVHYGRGKDWIPLPHLRKIAALLFAADPVLAQMHPSHRREESKGWCLSNRLSSSNRRGTRRNTRIFALKSRRS
ncbi:hypothetical protein F5B19DRAFT_476859 [Rostrohypoxylon terebratum]|nr:hypothetical protein F5B19DRAFT_476859 [Rostrohypoxylon terebratum]